MKKTKRNQKKLIFLVIILGIFLQSMFSQVKALDYRDISVTEAKNRIDNNSSIFILDVRSTPEFINEGHIIDAVNINVYFIYSSIDKLPEENNTEIIVYCDNGVRSKTGAEKLVNLGYTNVSNMKEGFNEWKKKGYPYVIGTKTTSNIISWDNLIIISITVLVLFLLRKKVKTRQ